MAKFPWLKLYTEIIDDPKLATWSGDQFRVFVMLLCLARESEEPGFIPLMSAEIAWRIRRPLEEVEATLELCQQGDRPIITAVEGGYQVLKFLERQYEKQSDQPAATRERKQKQRDKEKSHADVTPCHAIEEIRGDIDLDKDKDLKDIVPYVEIIGHLNQTCETKYKSSARTTKEHIRARWREGFRLDDFKKVIENKARDWIKDTEMSKFLRPETLFSNKFEGYLNQTGGQARAPDPAEEKQREFIRSLYNKGACAADT